MSLVFASNKIIPAPLVDMRKNYQRTADGQIISAPWSITLNGILIVDKGSPDSNGDFYNLSGYPADESIAHDSKLAALMVKQKALRELFSSDNDGQLLEIQPLDGSAPTKANVRITDLQFTRRGNDPWVDSMPYTVTMEADCIFIQGTSSCDDTINSNYITDMQDEWTVEAADENQLTYRITHRVSATGKRSYLASGSVDKEGYENARSYVLNTLTLGTDDTRKNETGVLNLDSYSWYNHIRSTSTNEKTGTYSVTETWLVFNNGGESYAAVEEYTVDSQISQAGLVSTRVQGTIRGLEVKNANFEVTTTKYTNAAAAFAAVSVSMYARASTYAGVTLNPLLLSSSVGRNIISGVITYAYEYDNRASLVTTDAISEIITETYDNPADVFAQIPVIGRAAGPVIQDIGSSTARRKNVSIEIVMPANTYTSTTTAPDTTALVASVTPSATIVKLERDQESWTGRTGRYSRNLSWVYEL